jgi:hypothetical protein
MPTEIATAAQLNPVIGIPALCSVAARSDVAGGHAPGR